MAVILTPSGVTTGFPSTFGTVLDYDFMWSSPSTFQSTSRAFAAPDIEIDLTVEKAPRAMAVPAITTGSGPRTTGQIWPL